MAMELFRVKCGHKATLVAERLRQQWHDLASSPGSGDEARLSLSFNWMQTILSSTNNTITSSSVTQTGIRYHNIIRVYNTNLNAQKMWCLFEIKTVAAKMEINQHSLCSSGFVQSILA